MHSSATAAVAAENRTVESDLPAVGDPRLSRRVLVVEDEPSIRQLIAVVVGQKFGCQIDEAANGLEAIERVQENSYALVISDLRMSPVGGIEFHRWLRESHPQMAGRLILVTGYTREPNLEQEIGRWQIPLVPKPFTIPALCRVCEPYLSQEKQAG